MLGELTANPLFGLVISIFIYELFCRIQARTKLVILNPLILTMITLIVLLKATGISPEDYNQGGAILQMMITPATSALAVTIYRNLETLKKNLLPVLGGCLAGALTAVGSSYFLCRLFGLSDELTLSVLPKSITTPFALAMSEGIGGIQAVTLICVTFAGIAGCIGAPLLIRLFRVKNPVASGIAIGSCSHALGTTKALEIGEVEGAMSGIAIGVTGLLTVIVLTVFVH